MRGFHDRWDDAESPEALRLAFTERRSADVEALLDALLEDLRETRRRISERVAKEALDALKRHAHFGRMAELADAIVENGQAAPAVLCLRAQAEIEVGRMTAAIDGLLGLREDLEARLREDGLSPRDRAELSQDLGEALGLLGRSYKQLYVDARPTPREERRDDLHRATEFYDQAYRRRLGDHLWAGVNRVALLVHAARVWGKPPDRETLALAQAILDAVARKEAQGPERRLEPLDLAKRVEALVALGRNPEAIEAVAAYLSNEPSHFAVRSMRRQLVELYGLTDERSPGRHILPMLDARLAELGAGGAPIALDLGGATRLERVLGETGYAPLAWLRTGLSRAAAVARLGRSAYEGTGTGFLFDGSRIDEGHAGRHLLLTNAHVCSPHEAVRAQYPYPLSPKEIVSVFLGLGEGGEPARVGVHDSLATSPPSELDYTLLEIAPPPPDVLPPPPGEAPTNFAPGDRVNVIGHPKGLGVQLSLWDNRVVGGTDRYLHYRAPTDPGSSGSPVFDQNWRLVALHHAYSSDARANEGIRIERVISSIRDQLA